MGAPSQTLASLRPDIAESMEEFDLAADREGFVGLEILPIKSVAKASGNFGRIPVNKLLKHPETARAPGTGFGRGRFRFEPDTYTTEEHGWEEAVDNQEAEIYSDYFDSELVAAGICLDVVLRAQEQRIYDAVLNTTVFTGDLTSALGTPWSTTSSDPITDMKNKRQAVWAKCGLWPDTLVINEFTFQNLQMNEAIIDRITSNGAGQAAKPSDITAAMLAMLFNLKQVLVSRATKNAANQEQTADFDPMWPTAKALLFRKHAAPSFKLPGLGRTIAWQELGPDQPAYESYDEVQIDGRVIRYRHRVGEKLLLPECAHVITNVAA